MTLIQKLTLSCLILSCTFGFAAVPVLAQDGGSSPEILELRSASGGSIFAEVLERRDPVYRLRVDGREIEATIRIHGESFHISLRDHRGQLLAVTEGGTDAVALSDTRGNTVAGPAGRLHRDSAIELFDAVVLLFVDADNLAKVRGQRVMVLPYFAIEPPQLLDLCCDEGTVSNCFQPGANNTCGPGQELVTCTHGNCEINGTWNCC